MTPVEPSELFVVDLMVVGFVYVGGEVGRCLAYLEDDFFGRLFVGRVFALMRLEGSGSCLAFVTLQYCCQALNFLNRLTSG